MKIYVNIHPGIVEDSLFIENTGGYLWRYMTDIFIANIHTIAIAT